MVVFDFDKTLIDRDTLFGFYRLVHGDGLKFKLKRLLLLCSAVLYKFKIFNNDILKSVGIFLFLKGKHINELQYFADQYAEQLKLNSIYTDVYLKLPKQERLVISASPEIYLKKVFPEEQILGTQLDYKDGIVMGLKFNCYASNKLERYKQEYHVPLKAVYSDSRTDLPLFNHAEEFYIVKNGQIQDI